MQAQDIDWQEVLNYWSRADIMYLKSICDEKLAQMDPNITKRRAIIRREE